MTSTRMPPLLLGAGLLFWGWQSGFLLAAMVMAAILECSRLVLTRWDLSDDDFARIWVFCTILFLAAMIYAFTMNEGPSDFAGLFQNPTLKAQRNAGSASARTAAAMVRWLPMVFFLFIAAQRYSSREGVPLETISLILRRRWKRAQKTGQAIPPAGVLELSYPYFALCLFAAGIHRADDTLYFWGLCVLLGWALWKYRSKRFSLPLWASALALAIVMGHLGQTGLGRLQRYLETFNPQWLSGFMSRGFEARRSQTGIGELGRIKNSGRIVIRLEPRGNNPPPPLLRETSYRNYKVQTWYAGSARTEFENVLPETNNTTWLLLPDKSNSAAVNIACYLDSYRTLLPLPRGCGRLENLPAYVLQKNSLGGVLAVGPGLVIFDALYGPGESVDSPPDLKEDLFVSVKEAPALDAALAELHLENPTREQAMKAVNAFFQSKFDYSIWRGADALAGTNETALGHFLLKTRKGHCEYFATATTLMLRRLHVPARYAVGYAVHEAAGKGYVVRQRDAHSWCLVWNAEKQSWEDFDTTPASWVGTENNRASIFQFLSDAWSRIRFEIAKVRWGQTQLRQYILWALAPVLIVLLFQIVYRTRRKKRETERLERRAFREWPGMDSEFYELERKIIQRGVERQPNETLATWLKRAAAERVLNQIRPALNEVLLLHYRYRFDPAGLTAEDRETLRRRVRSCVASL